MRERDVIVICAAVGGIVIIQLSALLAGINGVVLKTTIGALFGVVGYAIRNIQIVQKRRQLKQKRKG